MDQTEAVIMSFCHACQEFKPTEENFELLKTVKCTTKFKMFAIDPHVVEVRSFTCKDCGTTTQEEWIELWRQNS